MSDNGLSLEMALTEAEKYLEEVQAKVYSIDQECQARPEERKRRVQIVGLEVALKLEDIQAQINAAREAIEGRLHRLHSDCEQLDAHFDIYGQQDSSGEGLHD